MKSETPAIFVEVLAVQHMGNKARVSLKPPRFFIMGYRFVVEGSASGMVSHRCRIC